MSANSPDPQYLHVLSCGQPVGIITPHQRSIKTRFVTFTCAACLESVTQERFPGRQPSYCGENCRLAAAAERKRLSRMATGQSKGRIGRPRRQLSQRNVKRCITQGEAVNLAIDAIRSEDDSLWQTLARDDFHLVSCDPAGEWEIKIRVYTPEEKQPWLYTIHIDDQGTITGFLWNVWG